MEIKTFTVDGTGGRVILRSMGDTTEVTVIIGGDCHTVQFVERQRHKLTRACMEFAIATSGAVSNGR